jgi:hypothetical protein
MTAESVLLATGEITKAAMYEHFHLLQYEPASNLNKVTD